MRSAAGATALEFETVYYMKIPTYSTYMDVQQAINLHICQRFDAEGIAFYVPPAPVVAPVPPAA